MSILCNGRYLAKADGKWNPSGCVLSKNLDLLIGQQCRLSAGLPCGLMDLADTCSPSAPCLFLYNRMPMDLAGFVMYNHCMLMNLAESTMHHHIQCCTLMELTETSGVQSRSVMCVDGPHLQSLYVDGSGWNRPHNQNFIAKRFLWCVSSSHTQQEKETAEKNKYSYSQTTCWVSDCVLLCFWCSASRKRQPQATNRI